MSQTSPTTQDSAHETPMRVEPTLQHRWLQKLVGDWTYTTDMPGKPDEPPTKVAGVEHARAVGDIWVVAEAQGEMPGSGPSTSVTTLGYDPEKQRFVGTWIGSMMTQLWVYDGELDAGERVLTLHSVGPTMEGDGKTTKYQDIIEFKTDDHRTLTAKILGADGRWQQLMSVDYRRVR